MVVSDTSLSNMASNNCAILGYPFAITSRTAPPLPGLETVEKASVKTWTALDLQEEGR